MAKPTDFAVVKRTRQHSILITAHFLAFVRRKLFTCQECVSDFRLSSHIFAHPDSSFSAGQPRRCSWQNVTPKLKFTARFIVLSSTLSVYAPKRSKLHVFVPHSIVHDMPPYMVQARAPQIDNYTISSLFPKNHHLRH